MIFKKHSITLINFEILKRIVHPKRTFFSFITKIIQKPVLGVGKGEIPRNVRIPEHMLPEYAELGKPTYLEKIIIKSPYQISKMRDSCSLAANILNLVPAIIKPGTTTEDIDHLVYQACIDRGAYPSPLNYCSFPKSVCTSINEVAVHGIPDHTTLQEGDIISVDVSVYYKGFHGDCCATYPVGKVNEDSQRLMAVTKQCLNEAIEICRPGVPFKKIGSVISQIAEAENLSVIPLFCGHGVGQYFHEPPQIFHDENEEEGVMEEGMIFTIEPVLCLGSPFIKVLSDGWTAVLVDRSRSAQFEHTILITPTGHEVLTHEVVS